MTLEKTRFHTRSKTFHSNFGNWDRSECDMIVAASVVYFWLSDAYVENSHLRTVVKASGKGISQE